MVCYLQPLFLTQAVLEFYHQLNEIVYDILGEENFDLFEVERIAD